MLRFLPSIRRSGFHSENADGVRRVAQRTCGPLGIVMWDFEVEDHLHITFPMCFTTAIIGGNVANFPDLERVSLTQGVSLWISANGLTRIANILISDLTVGFVGSFGHSH